MSRCPMRFRPNRRRHRGRGGALWCSPVPCRGGPVPSARKCPRRDPWAQRLSRPAKGWAATKQRKPAAAIGQMAPRDRRRTMAEGRVSPVRGARAFVTDWMAAWNRFWFEPLLPHTLAVIRVFTGAMAAYIHAIWLSHVDDFMGPTPWVDRPAWEALHDRDWAWSWLWYFDQPALLIGHQVVAIVAALALMVGLATRITSVLSWWLMLMVCHRLTLALFGLDQIVVMLLMYLMLSQCGGVWSIDRRLRSRIGPRWWLATDQPHFSNRVATRLIQLHLCVIYAFSGLSKARGEMWFDGSALWYALVNYEYQSLDLVWLGRYPWLVSLLTLATLFWETFYCALVWPRLTRPFVLGMAVVVHGGIALALGMPTFGWMMIVANMAFIQPQAVRRIVGKLLNR
ncbi:MAG: HTTM domain-containing protein [Planctomycetota bacterium]|nr:MAG: HTTM domain-containing protein [Planctomycetota bacterium]